MPNVVTCGACEVTLISEDLENHRCSQNYRFEGNLLWIRSHGKWDICYYHPTMTQLDEKIIRQYYDPILKSLSPVFFDNIENRRKLGIFKQKPTDVSHGEDPTDDFTESITNRLINNGLENVKYYHKRFWEIKWLKQ